MKRIVTRTAAVILVMAAAVGVSACGPDKDQKDWSKYSAGLSVQSSRPLVR